MLNQLAPNFGSVAANTHFKKTSSDKSSIEAAEVVDIILDITHPFYYKPTLDSMEQGRPIGTIRFRRYSSERNKPEEECFFATPLNPYIKQYPLKHEIVTIVTKPTKISGTVTQGFAFYYTDIINIHNLVNSNELPYCTTITPERAGNSKTNSFDGVSTNKDSNQINLGDTFKQNIQITDLLPFEGDLIYQGRWGNSIRFGSTVPNKNDKNEWSTRGEAGDPLIILQSFKNTASNPPNYVVEEIDKSAACIYICDGQLIPLTPASNNFKAFETKPELLKSRENKQIIISSDRVVINGGPADRKGNVMIFGKQYISLSSAGSVNISSDKEIVIVSDKDIRLGAFDADQRAVLGDAFKEIFDIFINVIIKHVHPTGVGPTLPPSEPLITELNQLKQRFELKALTKKVKLK